MILGWPYSLVVALEPGRTSWTLPLDAVRLGPADDATAVTAGQVREVAQRRPSRHGAVLKLGEPRTWPAPAVTTITATAQYGTATAMAWARLHQRLATRAGGEDHDGEVPVIEGTLIRLAVGHLPGDRSPEWLWLWSSRAGTSAAEVDRTWQAFLPRFGSGPARRAG
jgi:hypothetical protein